MGMAMASVSVVTLELSPTHDQGVNSAALQVSDGLFSTVAIVVASTIFAAGHTAVGEDAQVFLTIFVVMFARRGGRRGRGTPDASTPRTTHRRDAHRFRDGGGVPVGSRPREHCGVPPPSVPPGPGSLGHRAGAPGVAAGGARRLRRRPAAGLPRRRHPWGGQDDVRPAHRGGPPRAPRRRGGHRGRPHRAPEAAVVPGGAPRRDRARPRVQQRPGSAGRRLRRRGRDLRPGRGAPLAAPAPDRAATHPRRARRGPPRRRRHDVGRGGGGGLRPGHPAAVADGHALPERHQPDPLRELCP